ncbi:MAG: DUF3025 domain-containing protein [Betaproteobacteria bacterium]|jgi:hypothetical protein|nr:DUF3025 domain-containing protein [Betaproteobacteria bacterium]
MSAGDPRWDPELLRALPPFAAVRPLIDLLSQTDFPTIDALNWIAAERGIATGGGRALRFVAPREKAGSVESSYEEHVFETGEVPTRESSWHDLFNALAWLAYPRTKAVLNRRHYEELRKRRGEPLRGTARDVLTLFDEGGMLVACAEPALAALVRDFRWKALFWERRGDIVKRMRFHVFGHAILENALALFRGVTAKALIVDVTDDVIAQPADALNAVLDARAADYFSLPDSLASTRTLAPLPVLGIPGWTPDNEDPAYYDDVDHFRPGRRPESTR